MTALSNWGFYRRSLKATMQTASGKALTFAGALAFILTPVAVVFAGLNGAITAAVAFIPLGLLAALLIVGPLRQSYLLYNELELNTNARIADLEGRLADKMTRNEATALIAQVISALVAHRAVHPDDFTHWLIEYQIIKQQCYDKIAAAFGEHRATLIFSEHYHPGPGTSFQHQRYVGEIDGIVGELKNLEKMVGGLPVAV